MTASKQQHDGHLAQRRKSSGPLQPSIPTAATGWEGWRIALQPIPDIVGWYKEHKIWGTLLITAFVIVKGFVIARGDITNALAIVQYAGVVGWAAAAVLSSLPLIAAAMLAISCYQVFWPLSGGLRFASWGQQLAVVGVAFLICAALAPSIPYDRRSGSRLSVRV